MGSGNVVTLNEGTFKRFVLGPNRPFHMVVLLNAVDPRHNCDLCREGDDEFRVLASSYARQLSGSSEAPSVFFATAEYGDNQGIFSGFKIRGVPQLVYFAPTASASHSASELPETGRFGGSSMDAEAFASFVRDKSGVDVKIYRSPWGKLFVLAFFLVSVGLFLRATWDKLWTIALTIRDMKGFWLLVSIGIYFIAISGVLYDIIRGAPAFGVSSKGTPQVFHPQSGQQYGVEGLIIGFLNVAAGFSAVALAYLVPKFNPENRIFASAVTIALFGFFYIAIVRLYQFKAPWYLRG